jgi:hypothetical protein
MEEKLNEINKAIDELQQALLENLDASQKEDDAKLAKIKAHNRLRLAKDIIMNL